jgi:hypothetical protein
LVTIRVRSALGSGSGCHQGSMHRRLIALAVTGTLLVALVVTVAATASAQQAPYLGPWNGTISCADGPYSWTDMGGATHQSRYEVVVAFTWGVTPTGERYFMRRPTLSYQEMTDPEPGHWDLVAVQPWLWTDQGKAGVSAAGTTSLGLVRCADSIDRATYS